jgi:hypothetical protein
MPILLEKQFISVAEAETLLTRLCKIDTILIRAKLARQLAVRSTGAQH